MPVYVLDTDHLSYLQKREPGVIARLAGLAATDRVFTSVVGMGELLKGVLQMPAGKRRQELLTVYRDALSSMEEILPITPSVAAHFAEIDAALRRKGRPIPTNDVWTAAVARDRNAVVVTNDRHFQHVDGLKTENWTSSAS